MTVPFVLGAISTASWLYASFIGVSRLIAPSMTLYGFMMGYALVVMSAIAVALVLSVRARLTQTFPRRRGGSALRSTR